MLMPTTSEQGLLARDGAEIVAKQCAATGTGPERRVFNSTDVGRGGLLLL